MLAQLSKREKCDNFARPVMRDIYDAIQTDMQVRCSCIFSDSNEHSISLAKWDE